VTIRERAPIFAALVMAMLAGCATSRHVVCPHDGGPTWRVVKTAHVTMVTDIPRDASVSIARAGETWAVAADTLLSHFLPDEREPPATVMVMFTEHWEYADVMPAGTNESGSTVPIRKGPTIVVASADREPSWIFGVARTRQLLAQRLGKMPLWLDLGLSEYFAQIEKSADGRRALGGLPFSMKKFAERHGPADALDPVPFAELFADHVPAPLRARWQLSTWVLAHYLANGAPDHGDRFRRFLRSVADGTPPLDAIAKEYGPLAEVEAAYRAHPRSFVEHKLLRWIFAPDAVGDDASVPRVLEVKDAMVHALRALLRPETAAREVQLLAAHAVDELVGQGGVNANGGASSTLPPVFPFGMDYGSDFNGGLPPTRDAPLARPR
jgi:hypothetical protein